MRYIGLRDFLEFHSEHDSFTSTTALSASAFYRREDSVTSVQRSSSVVTNSDRLDYENVCNFRDYKTASWSTQKPEMKTSGIKRQRSSDVSRKTLTHEGGAVQCAGDTQKQG